MRAYCHRSAAHLDGHFVNARVLVAHAVHENWQELVQALVHDLGVHLAAVCRHKRQQGLQRSKEERCHLVPEGEAAAGLLQLTGRRCDMMKRAVE
jgi:hypothetical protein